MPDAVTAATVPRPHKRVASIQVFRGLAAMLVVANHIQKIDSKYAHTGWLDIFQFGVVGVDIFFVLSGIVISMVTLGKFGSAPNALRFLRNRLTRVYPVYWVYTAIVLCAFLYNPALINAGAGHRTHILASFLLIPNNLPMLVMQGWTLSYEIWFYLIFTVLLFLPAKAMPWLLGCWAGLLVAFGLGLPFAHAPIPDVMTSPLILEFLAGCVLYQIYRSARLPAWGGPVLLLSSAGWLVTIIAWTAWHYGFDQRWIESSRCLRPAIYGTFALPLVLGGMEMERAKDWRFWRGFERVGDWSYSIYLSHLIVLEAVARTLQKVGASPLVMVLSLLVLGGPMAILVGALSFRFIEQPLIRLFHTASAPTSPKPFGGVQLRTPTELAVVGPSKQTQFVG
jgi:peptidoglycan/LPS O-acetylase OafA/YrhL